ncbi:UPF0149 family protein [Novosphingobium sp. BL-52-GroH]|uniref:UPF0149 family protein n=1 Tax=Novosphingobium sp. BL-52-GroH TaxID=3349877 RepID=UPI00384C03A6
MIRFPSRFRRLDEILGDLPIEDPLLLTELDGYLTGIAVCPEAILPAEWMPLIWGGGYGEGAPFEDPIDVQLFADMVLARYNDILRDLGRGKLRPIFDIDERNGDVLWEMWVGGFGMGTGLRADIWSAVAQGDDAEIVAAWSCMQTLADIASNETTLTSMEVNALCDVAPGLISEQVTRLFAVAAARGSLAPAPATRPLKVGRNEPCPCGSGKKNKRCCGAD